MASHTMAPHLVEDARDGAGASDDDRPDPPDTGAGSGADRGADLDTVLAALDATFAVGQAAWDEPAGAPGVADRRLLAHAAIRLARGVVELRPGEPEARALLALLLLEHARRDARTGPDGAPRSLARQDRSRWRRDEIAEGRAVLDGLLTTGAVRPGRYLVRAAIAALHDDAPTAADTEWGEILALYDVLAVVAPSPRVALERAVARGMACGREVGLVALDELEGTPGLEDLLPAARAELAQTLWA
jgi:RNA polymerase sigma-70 factor (ECF subfamily)